MLKRTIFISAGHHFKDPGASGNNLIERDEVIKIRDLLVPLLEEYFYVYVVPDHLKLQETVKYINGLARNLNDGLAIDLHMNAGGGSGAECFYYDYSWRGKGMAKKLLDKYCECTKLNNRKVKGDRYSASRYLHFIKSTNPWALLLELCFIDNKENATYFRNNREQVAQGVFEGILNIYNIKEKAEIKKKIKANLNEIERLVALV